VQRMFRKNDGHLQEELFSHYQTMNPKIAKMLKDTWAPIFYEHVFCKIDEEVFAPLYCFDNGRPNFPVNILLSLELIKNMFDYTDEEILEQFYFNYQVIYALGIKNIGEIYFAERTLYEFRERLVNYVKEHPDEEEIMFKQFEILTRHFIDKANIKTDEQRMDSTYVTPNIKRAGRLSLAYDFLEKAVKAIPQKHLSNSLKEVLEPSFKTKLLFKTKASKINAKLETVLILCTEIYDLAKAKQLTSKEEIKLLARFLNEQAHYDTEKKVWVPEDNKEISSASMQSAHDTDATFRNKNGKTNQGYVVNLAETCSKDNPVQLITDYDLDVNIKSDTELARKRVDTIKKNTDVTDLYVDGGYYGEETINKADEAEVKLHFTDMTGRKSTSNKLPLTNFNFNEEHEVEKCPAGKIPLRSDYSKKSKSTTTHFEKSECLYCPIREHCPVKPQKKSMVLRASKKAILAANTRQEISKKEIRRENTSKRAAIEGTNSAIKRGQGANKLRVRGLIKCQLQIGLKVIGHNFKQFSRAMNKPKPKGREVVCPM